jgi:RND family efflux transporter MFP subunit
MYNRTFHSHRALAAAVALLATAVLIGILAQRAGGQAQPRAKPAPSSQALFDRFDQFTPAARLQLLEKVARGDKEFAEVIRGEFVASVVTRGTITPAKSTDLVCKVRTPAKGGYASIIKWVIDDGTRVNQGDLVAQLDDADFIAALKDQKVKLEHARADLTQAREEAELSKLDGETALLAAEIEQRTAQLALKKHAGDDADEKEILKLNVERARVNQARAKAQVRLQEQRAQAHIRLKQAVLHQEEAIAHDIEQQIAACRMVAPEDGIVVYHVPEARRGGPQQPLVAQGEPVREGQKLLEIPDLSRMLLVSKVPEAVVSTVRIGQPAQVRVDAYPGKTVAGRVQEIGTKALHADWLTKDVKNYPIRLAIGDAAAPRLLPGMSAEVSIETGRAGEVLRVPAQAIVRAKTKSYCYVKRGKGLDKIEVVPGLRSATQVEIRSGLNEGDLVVRDPAELLRRLATDAPPGEPPSAPEEPHS